MQRVISYSRFNASTGGFGAVPACRGHRWIFNLATCYAGLTGRIRPKAVGHENEERAGLL